MKKIFYTLAVMAAAFLFCVIPASAEEGDWVRIVSVTPNSYDNYTDPVAFTVTVDYSLQSAEQGIVYLGFNTSQPNYYEIEEEPGPAGQVVSRGTGTVVLSKEVTPVNWDTAISRMQQYMAGISYPVTDFKVYANLSEYPHDIPWTPLAISEAVLTELPETEASTDESAGYGNWSGAYEDFVLGHFFVNNGDSRGYGNLYGEYDVVSFSLYDIDGNDTPELLIFNGFEGRDLRADYIFSYDGTKIVYCGSILPECYGVPDYPGLFATVFMSGFYMDEEYDGKYIGVTYLNHSTLESYSVVTDRVEITGELPDGNGREVIFKTDDTETYNAGRQTQHNSLRFMTLAEIEAQGWETFLKVCYEGTAETAPSGVDYKVYCGEGFPNGYEVFDCSLEDCLLKTDSDEYNPQLAHMLIAMCNSVYNGTNMEETFNSFGFESPADMSYDMEKMLLAYGMAKKQTGNIGNEKTLVLIVARGTLGFLEDLEEWKSNIDILKQSSKNQHEGFAEAANALYDRMIGENFLGTSDFSNVEFVITGFSRGAAVANILAARLADEGVAQSRIHAYTFACPDTVKITDRTAGRYKSIFNIANAKDFVSWVPRLYLGNEWNKYGQSYWYCDDWNDYQNLEMGMDAHNQQKYLEYLRSERSGTEYWIRSRAKLALDAAAMQRNMDALHKMGYHNTRVVYTGVYCPVDVEIFISDGRLAGSVVNNVAENILGDKVYISVDGSRKHIYFLDEDTYTLRLTATDDGIMCYTVQSIDVETQETTEEKVFSAVVLTDGRQMTSSITVKEDGDTDTGEAQLFVLGEDGLNIVEIQENGEEIPLPEKQDVGVEETDKGESGAEQAVGEEFPTEEKNVEDTDVSGIPLAAVFLASAIVSAFIGICVFFRSTAKRRRNIGAIKPGRNVRFCSRCGKRISPDASFCGHCGMKKI